MFPILVKLGPLTIRTYGLMIAVGMFAGLQYLLKYLRSAAVPENRVLDMVLYAIIAGLVGARLTYVVLNGSYYLHNPADIFKIWEGGLVFYGGFAAGVGAVIAFIRMHPELRLWHAGDVFGPALALAHSFGRLGCLFAGCCYGRECHLPWAITFTNPGSLAPLNIPRHPTQLYEALGTLAVFFALDRHRRSPHAEGTTFGWYLISYSVLRFVIEFARGDDRGGALLGMSPSQMFSLLILAAGVVIVWLRKQRVQ